MPKLNLKELLSEQLKDVDNKDDILTKIDVDAIQQTIDNDYVNPIVKKTKEETNEKLKDEAREAAVNEFINNLNVDGVENEDGFKAYVKRLQATTDEKDETISKYEKELNEIKPEYEKLSSSLEKRNAMDKIIDAGFDRKYAEDVYTIAKNKAGEDEELEKVLDGMKDEYSMFVDRSSDDSGSYVPGGEGDNPPDPEKEIDQWRQEAGLPSKKT